MTRVALATDAGRRSRLIRSAFTLIEVMIVLTIVVGLMAIAWPRMRRMAAKSQIREAAVEFKAACAEARDQAVRSGKPVFLRYQLGRSHFRLSDSGHAAPMLGTEPLVKRATGIQVLNDQKPVERMEVSGAPRDLESSSARPPYDAQYELALGIVFDDPSNQNNQASAKVGGDALVERDKSMGNAPLAREDQLRVGATAEADWEDSEQIIFYPEGRATSATVRILAADTGDSIMLRVRGLTAGVAIGKTEKRLMETDVDALDRLTPDRASPARIESERADDA